MILFCNLDLYVYVFLFLLGKGVFVFINRVCEEFMVFFYNLYLLGGYVVSEKKI